jgi:hypothetical protein
MIASEVGIKFLFQDIGSGTVVMIVLVLIETVFVAADLYMERFLPWSL